MSSQDTGNQHQNEISWNLQLFGGVDNKTFLSALSAFMKTIKPIALHLHYLLSLKKWQNRIDDCTLQKILDNNYYSGWKNLHEFL